MGGVIMRTGGAGGEGKDGWYVAEWMVGLVDYNLEVRLDLMIVFHQPVCLPINRLLERESTRART